MSQENFDKYVALGKLNMDDNPKLINKDGEFDFVQALGITFINLGGQNDWAIQNLDGNGLAFTLPTVAQQNKIYQLIFKQSTGILLGVDFLNLSGSNFVTQYYTTTGNLATDTTTFGTDIGSALTSAGITSTIDTSVPGTITITLTTQIGFDYTIVNDPSSVGKVTINILQEAIDHSLIGKCLPIGSCDLLGDLFVFSTSQQNSPVNYNVTGAVSAGGLIQLSIGSNLTGLVVNGDSIVVENVGGTIEANGTWIVNSISYGSTTTLVLYNSSFANAYTSGGTITTYASGLLNIQVNQASPDRTVWTSTVLLQTKQLNNRFYNPLTYLIPEPTNGLINLYFSDNNDYPRIFTYEGPYATNGAIEVIDVQGFYLYDNIEGQTRFFITNATTTCALNALINAGGGVFAGGWRYATILLDSSLNPTLPSLLSNLVEVFSGDQNNPITVMGNTAGIATDKMVSLQINDIPANTYSFLQLVGVNYVAGASVGYLIKTVPIPANATSLTVIHTGNEIGVANYDTTLLEQVSAAYKTVKSAAIVSNNFVMANLTTDAVIDFSNFTKTFTHTVKKGTTQLKTTYDDTLNWGSLGDYQVPQATFALIGYTDNETERFACQYELTDGTRTKAFWCDDIRMDNYATNRANPFNNNRRVGSPFTNYNLSSNLAFAQYNNSYVTYVTFIIPETNYLIDGVPFSSLVKRIHFMRVNTVANGVNEVLGSGLIIRHCYQHYSDASSNYIYGDNGSTVHAAPTDTVAFDNPFIIQGFDNTGGDEFLKTGMYPIVNANPILMSNLFSPSGTYTPMSYGAWNGTGGSGINVTLPVRLNEASFYCPDFIFGQSTITNKSGDAMIVYGQPDFRIHDAGGLIYADVTNNNTFSNGSHPASNAWSVFLKMSGATNQTSEPTHNTINAFGTVSNFAGQVPWVPSISGVSYYSGLWVGGAPYGHSWSYMAHYLISCANPMNNVNSAMWNGAPNASPYAGAYDLGCYYAQYYRDLGSLTASANAANYPNNTKFGAINTGTYVQTGVYLDVVPNETNVSIDVYGGDTFTQKVFPKLRYPNMDFVTNNAYDAGAGIAIAFFCQNRFNWNMRNMDVPSGMFNYPAQTLLGDWLNDGTPNIDNQIYDAGYTPEGVENQAPAFDATATNISLLPNTEAFSLTKPDGSLVNLFRIFPPLNVGYLPAVYGPITKIFNFTGELFALQPKRTWRQYFNSTMSLKALTGSGAENDVILGTGAPLSQEPTPVSTEGCSHLFSVLQAKVNGHDVYGWVDTIARNIKILTGNGGVKEISLEGKMRSWFENNMSFITGDNPNIRNGISGVYDKKRNEFIWTFYSLPQPQTAAAWSSVTSYTTGQYVVYGSLNFEGYYTVYQAKSNNINQPPTNTTFWKVVPANQYTVAYNFLKQSFLFYPPKPYMYMQWQETYLSAYPSIAYNGIYLSDVGSPLTWYAYNSASQQVQGYFAFVINKPLDIVKRFIAMQVSSALAPYRIDVYTDKLQTFMLRADWKQPFAQSNVWKTNIFNDILSSAGGNNPKSWTSKMIDEYCIVKVTFNVGEEQKITSFVSKFITMNRTPFT